MTLIEAYWIGWVFGVVSGACFAIAVYFFVRFLIDRHGGDS